jgi:hypothetical protein
MVGVARFEPTTSCSRSKRSTKLSYTPLPLFIEHQVLGQGLTALFFACMVRGIKLIEDDTLGTKGLLLNICSILILGACTSKPEVKKPEERVMHYPSLLALSPDDETLLVASSNLDDKYDRARLISISRSKIKNALAQNDTKNPLPWSSVVTANTMIGADIGGLNISMQYISFVTRQNNQLVTLPVPLCNKPKEYIDSCPKLSSLELHEHDPFSIDQFGPGNEHLIISYLMASRIDIMNLQEPVLPNKTVDAQSLLKEKMPNHKFDKYIIGINKIFISKKNDLSQAKAYFLINEIPKNAVSPVYAKASYLLAINMSHLLGNQAITASMIDLIDLTDKFAIASAQDLHIDDNKGQAYVLSRIPQALYLIDLTKNELLKTGVACNGATSIAMGNDFLVVPCFTENLIAMYSLDLDLINTSPYGRGPLQCVIDKAHDLIFCTISEDGILAIYDKKLGILGHVFDKAPLNRMGS